MPGLARRVRFSIPPVNHRTGDQYIPVLQIPIERAAKTNADHRIGPYPPPRLFCRSPGKVHAGTVGNEDRPLTIQFSITCKPQPPPERPGRDTAKEAVELSGFGSHKQ
jgi:hypothetical protein